MGLIKDWRSETRNYAFSGRLKDFFTPKVWFRLHERRQQRADRGWADQDCWNMGDHIAEITADMLEHLQKHGVTDWDAWFKFNIKDDLAYTNLQDIIDDIRNYLRFSETTWAEDLTSVPGKTGKFSISWVNEKGKKITEAEITNRINKWHKQSEKLYNKASRAMQFFARHFTGFWD